MKTLFRKIKSFGRRASLGLAFGISSWIAAPSATAQVGTYVVPRPYILYAGWVTNTETITNAFVLTNWLSPSAWHNINLFISEQGTNNIGTNQVNLSLYGSGGSGNSYTNPAAGTNFEYTGLPILAWNNNLTTQTNSTGTYTNLTQALADGFTWIKGSIYVTATNIATTNNAFYLQIDGFVTP